MLGINPPSLVNGKPIDCCFYLNALAAEGGFVTGSLEDMARKGTLIPKDGNFFLSKEVHI